LSYGKKGKRRKKGIRAAVSMCCPEKKRDSYLVKGQGVRPRLQEEKRGKRGGVQPLKLA